jgi:hypothetical protein
MYLGEENQICQSNYNKGLTAVQAMAIIGKGIPSLRNAGNMTIVLESLLSAVNHCSWMMLAMAGWWYNVPCSIRSKF